MFLATNTNNIAVNATISSNYQYVPWATYVNKFYIDGKEITSDGNYYCNELKVTSRQDIINPSQITDYNFPLKEIHGLLKFIQIYLMN